jgi:hypothetical protein
MNDVGIALLEMHVADRPKALEALAIALRHLPLAERAALAAQLLAADRYPR